MMVFEYLREILRVLKVGGKFCLQFVDYYYGGQNEWQKGTLEQNFKKISELKMWGGSINFYKEEELKQLFEKLGVEFNIERFEFTGEFNKLLSNTRVSWLIVSGVRS